MNALFAVVVVIQVLAALVIIGLVLLQHGKGADMGAAFGSGASGSLFGASGSSNFLSKSTGIAAAIFFGATLALAFIGNKHSTASGGVMENLRGAPAPVVSESVATGSSNAPKNANTSANVAPSGGVEQSNQIPK
ncbi:MAG TPA: preprotein translocase subunit SecG [Noviherbaspirillum sp.]